MEIRRKSNGFHIVNHEFIFNSDNPFQIAQEHLVSPSKCDSFKDKKSFFPLEKLTINLPFWEVFDINLLDSTFLCHRDTLILIQLFKLYQMLSSSSPKDIRVMVKLALFSFGNPLKANFTCVFATILSISTFYLLLLLLLIESSDSAIHTTYYMNAH